MLTPIITCQPCGVSWFDVTGEDVDRFLANHRACRMVTVTASRSVNNTGPVGDAI